MKTIVCLNPSSVFCEFILKDFIFEIDASLITPVFYFTPLHYF